MKTIGLADIIRKHGEGYRRRNRLTKEQHKALSAIINCRTPRLGKHITQCNQCSHQENHLNSCRNRHCPTCQSYKSKQWVEKRISDLIETPYFHVVFTLPKGLKDLIMYNRRLFFDLFFKASAETLKTFAKDPKHLGAGTGFYGILHTWGQKLWFHPHIHYVMPSGGYLKDKEKWVKSKHGNKFLFPVIAVSEVFRGKLISALKKQFKAGKLIFDGDSRSFELYLDNLACQKWVVYAKSPFKKARHVVEYIGRYTHRVAISNSRILSLDKSSIRFKYKDYKDNFETKVMELKIDDFIQRFLFHILPKGFQRIRHYGFYCGASRKDVLIKIQDKLNKADTQTKDIKARVPEKRVCSICESGEMHLYYLDLITFSRFFKMNSS